VTVALPAGGNRPGPATGVRVGETPATAARELAIRVRIVAEAEVATVSATAAFPVAAVVAAVDLAAPAHSAAAQEAALGAAVHAAHPAWAVPGAAAPVVVAGGGGE
jgi:pilus assembly protein FimV